VIWLAFIGLVGLIALTLHFWKQGAVAEAEHPQAQLDMPVLDPKERKVFLKRCVRWRDEGKLSREEFERLVHLCETDW
jgi:hypothetical protein